MNRLFVWLMRTLLILGTCLAVIRTNETWAQSSSLFHRASANTVGLTTRVPDTYEIRDNLDPLQRVSYFAVKPLPKRIFKVGNLLTVIVRQKSTYTHDGKTDLERKLKVKAELKDWVRLSEGHLVPDTLPAGDPKINFALARGFDGEGKMDRKDEVVTRITCRIIDVMPNGNLVLEGGPDLIKTDGEEQKFMLTGVCRSEDILPDNTIISTQIAELHFTRESSGAVRDTMNRGWIYKIWDKVRPF